ncbi:MAG: GNAT family N-acetyltransferase [Lactobacillales bacterium]|jgi:GNAT superfamily N-acetyltransferase|nr:GNAT family N-acetyltransferase [Lactobacillales bacterium]
MELIIREATQDDKEYLQLTLSRLFEVCDNFVASDVPFELVKMKQIDGMFGEHSRTFILNADGENAGFIHSEIYENAYSTIENIYVEPSFRNKGLGQKAIAYIDDIAVKAGSNALDIRMTTKGN